MAACHGQAKEGGTIRAARCLSPPPLDTLASAGVFFFGQVREEEVARWVSLMVQEGPRG